MASSVPAKPVGVGEVDAVLSAGMPMPNTPQAPFDDGSKHRIWPLEENTYILPFGVWTTPETALPPAPATAVCNGVNPQLCWACRSRQPTPIFVDPEALETPG